MSKVPEQPGAELDVTADGSAAPLGQTLSHGSQASAPRASSRPVEPRPYRDPNRYQIIGEHGRGGLGRVTRAHDRELGRDIAIKELISRGVVGEMRFVREALITARLEHPGIVPVYEAGSWPDGTPFYAMKLVAGRPLRALISERPTVEDRLALLHHVIAVTDAIAYAHGRGVIHRDLKPSNVIVGDFGETVVIDWGLAKDLGAVDDFTGGAPSPTSQDDGLTSVGSVLGTPAYMAPEQARGEPVDQRADVFAIGVMLWELGSLVKLPPRDRSQRRRL
ncbi:MAG TPA: serine/threonine-protein kinase, partial [Kofleriaceae bacterium]